MKTFIIIFFIVYPILINSQTNWTLSNSGIPSGYGVSDFAVSPSGTVYLSSYILQSSPTIPKLLKSNNNGANWTEVNLIGIDDGVMPVSIIFSGNKMLLSGFNSVTSVPEVYSSNNNGQSWTLSNSGIPSGYGVSDFAVSPSGTVYLSSYILQSSPTIPKLLKSNNNGANWTEVNLIGIDDGVMPVSIIFSGNKMLLSGFNSVTSVPEVYSSNNNGQSWTLSNSGIPSGYGVSDFAVSPSGTVYLSSYILQSSPTIPKLLKSNNNGANWTEVNLIGIDDGVMPVSIIFSGNKMLLSGFNSVTSAPEVYSSNYDPNSIDHTVFQKPLCKAFPNPTKGILKIESEYSSDYKIRNMMLITIYGSVVKTINKNFSSIDISDLPNGIYFLRFEYLNNHSTITIIKN